MHLKLVLLKLDEIKSIILFTKELLLIGKEKLKFYFLTF